MTFKFGQLQIDPVSLGSAGNAILGIRDSGKTYTATLLAEQLFDAGVPFVAFDPIGVWRFLRVPGKGCGYPIVVAGGQHGDLPLSPHSAPAIVEAAMQNGVSLVLDLFSMELSKADWKRIVRDSVRLMLHKNGPHGLRHIFVEEAAEFAPQRVIDGDVYAEMEKLARMGGNARLGYTLINQRAEEVNKALLELCDNLFLHRQKGRNSLTALSKWLDVGAVKDHRQIIDTLSTLPTGECWAWLAGTERPVHVKVPAKNSLHPDRRVMRGDADAPARAAVDVGQFVETMRSTLTTVEAEAKAKDPVLLQRRISELERQLAQGGATTPADLAAEYTRGREDGFEAGKAKGLELSAGGFEALRGAVREARSAVGSALDEIEKGLENWQRAVHADGDPQQQRQSVSPPPPARARVTSGQGEALPKSERLILTALAQYPNGRSKTQIAVLTGYAVNGGAFNNALGSLRSRALITRGDPIQVTEAGLRALGSYDPLPHGHALLQHWMGNLGKAERLVLRALADVYPKALNKHQIAVTAGYEANGGAFNNALGRLRTLELIKGRGDIKASEDLFG